MALRFYVLLPVRVYFLVRTRTPFLGHRAPWWWFAEFHYEAAVAGLLVEARGPGNGAIWQLVKQFRET